MSAHNSDIKPDSVIRLGDYHRGFEKLDQFDFHHRLESGKGASVVLFIKPGCSSCRAWRLLMLEYQKQNMKLALYEVDVEEDPSLAHEFELFHLPALYLYLDGKFHCELQCEASLQAVQEAIKMALHGPAQESP